MRACFGIIKTDNQGKVQYAYLLFIAAFMVLLGCAVLENGMVLQVKNRIDNVLTVSGFSGTLCDCQKIFQSMSVLKRETDGQIYYDFETMYKNADVRIEEKELEERVRSMLRENILRDGMMRELIMDYSLDGLILYNPPFDGQAVAPNGVVLEEPGIYLRLKLNIRGLLGKIHTVYMDKCVIVRVK